jgi:biotin synthase-like enzyme
MGDAIQALCFLAGANSIFYGDKLLVTGNPDTGADVQLLARLGMSAARPSEGASTVAPQGEGVPMNPAHQPPGKT